MVKRIGCRKCTRCRTILLVDDLLDMMQDNAEDGTWKDRALSDLLDRFEKLARDVAVAPCES